MRQSRAGPALHVSIMNLMHAQLPPAGSSRKKGEEEGEEKEEVPKKDNNDEQTEQKSSRYGADNSVSKVGNGRVVL